MTVKSPTKNEKRSVRLMIIMGLIGIANFVYWFFSPKFINNRVLFVLLAVTFTYTILRIIYEWYHYWNISVLKEKSVSRQFTVDIFTTFFPGEPYEMVENTLEAIQKINYPHFTYLCDEANDSYLIELCNKLGVIHVTRNNRKDAKAGNINNALRFAKGEICVILDPDHVPSPDFLDHIIPHFEDDSIGFVQIVQAYDNLHESYIAKGAAQQTFQFYGPIMMTMNSYGTVNAIGANCTFRRKALDSIGGHAAGLSEDMHTAMQLHAKGWKSVYLPKVLTRGLVPSSLTAYYKQQLKWSRGTLELLVSVYPKLFKNFTWRQKIHYGLIPFHYLIGIFYLINFLIPVISLLTSTTPWKGNVVFFSFLILPVVTSVVVIRNFVQSWVMEEQERGIHAVGGLLQITTWWVFCLGFIYTVIRKKVPYLPTPKTGEDKTSWKLVAPNVFIGALSLFAVIFGLLRDFTPFSVFMSGFAIFNAVLMFLTIYLANHRYEDISGMKDNLKRKVYSANYRAKVRFWRFRHRIYKMIRILALPILFLSFVLSYAFMNFTSYMKWEGAKSYPVLNQIPEKYIGLYAPGRKNGISGLSEVKTFENLLKARVDIVSYYIPWEDANRSGDLSSILKECGKYEYTPLITWEPWSSTFNLSDTIPDLKQEKKMLKYISQGVFDQYIIKFSDQIKAYNEPVYLRFAHEFDNPGYPWSLTGQNSEDDFKEAWKHVWNLFEERGVTNVKWVWNPWKADCMKDYYPGDKYVDYIGITALNFGSLNPDKQEYSFSNIYDPFRNNIFNMFNHKPVILAEFGSLKKENNQNKWICKALEDIYDKYPEIDQIVFFNSEADHNVPLNNKEYDHLDWSIQHVDSLKIKLWQLEYPSRKHYSTTELITINPNKHRIKNYQCSENFIGINYKKGQNWYKSYKVLDRKTLLADFNKMKSLGINSVRYWGNPVYNYNFFNISQDFDIKIAYGFWIPKSIEFTEDPKEFNDQLEKITNSVKLLKDTDNIASWHIGNDVISSQFIGLKSEKLKRHQLYYLKWLNKLTTKIREIDPKRPIVLCLDVNKNSVYHAKLIMSYVNNIDALALNIENEDYLKDFISYAEENQIAYLIGDIAPALISKIAEIIPKNKGTFFRNWQDQHENNLVSYDGILDHTGNFKWEYAMVKNYIDSSFVIPKEPKVGILPPAQLLYTGKSYIYSALIYNDSINEWTFPKEDPSVFEWNLIKYSDEGNALAFVEIGKGPYLNLKIPEEYKTYKLALKYKEKGFVKITNAALNTPDIETK